LLVRENEISLHKWSVGICAPLREHCLWESRPLHWKLLP